MNFLYRLYFFIPSFSNYGILGKIIDRILGKALKIIFDKTVANNFIKTQKFVGNGVNTIPREEIYIVSLTSFPERIDSVWICIESLMRQTFKPDRIILWLASEQFPDKKFPVDLVKLIDRGLEIKFCDDLKSHKKYYYVMKEFPNENIITFDDDIYYPNNILEQLVKTHLRYPSEIISNRVHKMVFSNDKTILPYKKWKHNFKGILKPSNLLVPTGVAGVLYPPNVLDEIVFDKDLIKKLCHNADDLWLKFTAFKKGTKTVTNKYFNKDLITIGKTHENSLIKTNGSQGGNDEQFKKLNDYFKFDFQK